MREQLSKSSFSTLVPCLTSLWYFAQVIGHTLPKSQSIAPIGKKISMGEKKVKFSSEKSW
ncbi:MAG: hypothetical protein KBA86_09125 [Bacteroidales bacterium]|nr:hypothetical protein [Bacteroidales bacterium]